MKKVFNRRLLFSALKIATGCVVAVFICTLMNLQFSATAGLITVLSIHNTKKETVFTALKRIAAFFAAVILRFTGDKQTAFSQLIKFENNIYYFLVF